MSAVSDQFLDQGFDGGDEESTASDAASDTPAPEAKADTPAKADTVETKGDTSKPAETPTADTDEIEDHADADRRVPLKVATSERKKRQELERQLAEARGELTALRAPGQARPSDDSAKAQPPKRLSRDDAYADPAGYAEQVAADIRGEYQSKLVRASEKRAIKEHGEKLSEYIDGFAELAKRDPRLVDQMNADDDPVVFAANYGRTYLEAKGMGDLNEWRESERKKIREDERQKARREAALATAETIPASNVTARSASAKSGVDRDEIDEPEDLADILPRGRRK